MKVHPECFSCLVARSLAVAARVTDDKWLQHKVLGKAMTELSETERDATPAEVMCGLVQLLSKTLGSPDPFQKEREEWFTELESVTPAVETLIAGSSDPLRTALTVAARVNVFDDERVTARRIRDELQKVGFKAPDEPCPDALAFSDYEDFKKDLAEANELLFVHDSATELPFDRLLFAQLRAVRPELRITSVVRAQRTLLDASREDAERFELSKWPGVVEVIDPGATVIGLPFNDCSREFRDIFDRSDLVLAKGQAHFETLDDLDKRAYFLLRVKCGVFARSQGSRVGDLLFFRR